MDKVYERAFAKVNLSLKITGKRGSYHTLESIIKFVDLADEVTAEAAENGEIAITYSGLIDGRLPGDNAARAARLVMKKYGCGGIKAAIKKNIPLGAGLGGSSADAAAVIRAMQRLYSLEKIPNELLLEAGSDVPCMYRQNDCIIEGTGEKVKEITLPRLNLVLITIDSCVNTADAYRAYDTLGGEDGNIFDIVSALQKGENPKLFNALQRAAESINPEIRRSVEALEAAGFLGICMTGSGSGVFALETNLRDFDEKLKKLVVTDGKPVIFRQI